MKLIVFEVVSVEEATLVVEIAQKFQPQIGCYLMVGQENDLIDYSKLREIKQVCSKLPLIARIRKGHVMEAKLCKELDITIIDEHDQSIVDEHSFSKSIEYFSNMTFINPANTFPEALRNIAKGAKIIRTHFGELNSIIHQIKNITNGATNIVKLNSEQLDEFSRREYVPKELLLKVKEEGFNTPLLAYGGINSPADISILLQLPNVNGVVISNEIFKMKNTYRSLQSLVAAVLFYDNPSRLLEISMNYPHQQHHLLFDSKGSSFVEALPPEKTSILFQTIPSPSPTLHQEQRVEEDTKMMEDSSSFLPNNDFM